MCFYITFAELCEPNFLSVIRYSKASALSRAYAFGLTIWAFQKNARNAHRPVFALTGYAVAVNTPDGRKIERGRNAEHQIPQANPA